MAEDDREACLPLHPYTDQAQTDGGEHQIDAWRRNLVRSVRGQGQQARAPGTHGGQEPQPLNPHALWHRVKAIGAAARQAGVVVRELAFSPHLFRRTYATLL